MPVCHAQSSDSPRIEAIRFWSFGDVTRIAVETKGDFKIHTEQIDGPPRLFFDLHGLRPPVARKKGVQSILVGDSLVKQIRIAETTPGVTRIVFDLQSMVEFNSSQLGSPDRLIIEIRPKDKLAAVPSVTPSSSGSQRFGDGTETLQPEGAPASVSTAKTTPHPTTTLTTRPLTTRPLTTRRTLLMSDLPVPPGLVAPRAEMPDLAAQFPPPVLPYYVELQSAPLKLVLSYKSKVLRPGPFRSTNVQVAETSGRGVQQGVNAKDFAPVSETAILDHPRGPLPVAATLRPPAETALTRPASNSLPTESTKPVAPAKTDSSGNRSLVRVFGLKMGKVVIDAGHGGHDTGTIGPHGLNEKDLVLDVSLRLGKLIQQRLGSEVIYTRSDDTFIPLEQRPRIANDEKADLFISIHANSSPVFSATGVETYYFNFTSEKSALDLATRENAAATSSIHELNDLLQQVVLKTKVEESREFASKVQGSLYPMSAKMNTRAHDRGVRKAPFVVLIGATMPSILAEIGFVSNPHDEPLLKKNDQRQKIAEALYKGIEQYANTLSHEQIARVKSSE
jgi:N-acetylmuramoyl-L-alanine amidase